MSDVQTHMRVQDAIEAAILDRGVEPPADLADIVFAAARAALESAPSSLRAELAEAKAEIARLEKLADRNTHTLDARSARIYQMERIVEAAKAFVPEWNALDYDVRCTVYGDRPRLVEAADAVVAAVEEGGKS